MAEQDEFIVETIGRQLLAFGTPANLIDEQQMLGQGRKSTLDEPARFTYYTGLGRLERLC